MSEADTTPNLFLNYAASFRIEGLLFLAAFVTAAAVAGRQQRRAREEEDGG